MEEEYGMLKNKNKNKRSDNNSKRRGHFKDDLV